MVSTSIDANRYAESAYNEAIAALATALHQMLLTMRATGASKQELNYAQSAVLINLQRAAQANLEALQHERQGTPPEQTQGSPGVSIILP